MSKKDKKVIKFNRFVRINAVTVIIFAIMVYLICVFVSSLNKDVITTYTVTEFNVSNDISLDGIIVRNEEILSASCNGYLCCYEGEGQKVPINKPVFTIDSSGTVVNNALSSNDANSVLSDEDFKNLRATVSNYKYNYSDLDFGSIYMLENQFTNEIYEFTSKIISEDAGLSGSTSLNDVKALAPGVLSYNIDSFEHITVDNISADLFKNQTTSINVFKTGDEVKSGNVIAKVVTSDKWNIICPITDEDASLFEEGTLIRFKITGNNLTIRAPFEIIQKPDGKYLNIQMTRYMIDFLQDRYVKVVIKRENDSGLKVPVSAVVSKDVVHIPRQYLTAAGDEKSVNKLGRKIKRDGKDSSLEYFVPDIIYSDEDYIYVDIDEFLEGDKICDITNDKETLWTFFDTSTCEGVYVANKGQAEFRYIKYTKQIGDFYVVDPSGNIKSGDQIVLNQTDVKESQIIY